jgi:hypothetical protein
MDGWMDGWMDGCDNQATCFGQEVFSFSRDCTIPTTKEITSDNDLVNI